MLDGVKLTWLGHSTFLITTPEQKTILVDPWLGGNPSCPAAFHEVRVDAILITHGHNDHMGDVFTAHERCAGPIVGIFDLTTWLGFEGVPQEKLLGVNKGGTVSLPGLDVTVHATQAHHSSSFTRDGQVIYLGEPLGYVLTFSNGKKLYISGDTCVFGDMALIAELERPDVAILPIGDHFTMDPRQAAYACKLLKVSHVVPCHFATFPLLTGTPAALEQELSKLAVAAEVVAPVLGEAIG